MNNEILYILLPDYAAHEIVYLSQAVASDEFALKENPKYVNKVVAPTMEPVKSIGGFRTLPDYSFETMPDDYEVKHTGNGLEQLKLWGGDCYTNPAGYIHAQAVSDRNIVTANGSATLEFAKELLLLLENDTPERIEMYYQFNKQGFCLLCAGQ